MVHRIKKCNLVKLIKLYIKYGVDDDIETQVIEDCKVFNLFYIGLGYIIFLVSSLIFNIDIVSSMPVCLGLIIFCAVYKVRQLLDYGVMLYEKKYNKQ